MNKKFAAIGLSAGLMAGAGAGFILQSAGSAGAADRVLAATATTDGTADSTTADAEGRPDPASHLQTVLQPLLDDGSLTQEQVDKVVAALAAAHQDGRMGRNGVGHGDGHGGGRSGDGHGGMGRGGAKLDTVATALGITAEEVRAGIESGKTIAELASDNGTTAQAVIDALVADATTHINQAVTDGKLTQEEADTKLAELATRIADFVNTTPQGGRGHGPRGGDAATMPTDSSTDTTTGS